ncbi:cytochrome P450 [Paraphaeosphaeria sporulosa]|uniref:Cytochrome P450 n=1 Tax=Paraphaeosphaeria sporulosa TaxID=1460663 RepID=A0A177C6A9_9PLEO|nr:cytochrome P450 [Paraphaeosphaeria sporulosa]OAG02412.1 cytochrome P450 [Paraphaeosphaeria sporulosa]
MLYLVFSTFIACLLGAKLTAYVRHTLQQRRNGCLEPPSLHLKDRIFGLDLFFKKMRALKAGDYLEGNTALFKLFSSKTYRSYSFGTTTYHTIDPEVVKSYQSTFFKDFGIEPLRYHLAENLWGNGIVVADGQRWASARSFIRSSFDVVHTANIDRLDHHVQRLMELIPRDGSTVDLMPLFKRLILDTSSEFIFGQSLNALDDPDVTFMEAFEFAQRGTGMRMMLGRLRFLHRDAKWYAACDKVTSFCEQRVEEALERLKSGQERRTERDRLRLVDEAAKLTTDRYTLRSLILSVFSPAHDGAAVALSNVFFHLARHPRDVILPTGGGLDGNSPLLCRKGDIIEADYRTMMRDPDFWGPDAEDFLPERWEKVRPGWEYLPFGGGPRQCPGTRLVFTECAFTTVKILREFTKLENRDEETEWKEQMRMTWQSKNGTLVGLVPA